MFYIFVYKSVLYFAFWSLHLYGNKIQLSYPEKMENPTINDRISELIKFLDQSPTGFADEIGIQRSGLSHILKGRNKPSLDMVQKIVARYPEINLTWLVNGTGHISSTTPSVINLRQKTTAPVPETPAGDPLKNTLFDTEMQDSPLPQAPPIPPATPAREAEKPGKGFTHEDFIVREQTTVHQADNPLDNTKEPPYPGHIPALPGKKITKILVFYNDQTFEEIQGNWP